MFPTQDKDISVDRNCLPVADGFNVLALADQMKRNVHAALGGDSAKTTLRGYSVVVTRERTAADAYMRMLQNEMGGTEVLGRVAGLAPSSIAICQVDVSHTHNCVFVHRAAVTAPSLSASASSSSVASSSSSQTDALVDQALVHALLTFLCDSEPNIFFVLDR